MISAVLVFCSVSWLQCKDMIEHVWFRRTDIHCASMQQAKAIYFPWPSPCVHATGSYFSSSILGSSLSSGCLLIMERYAVTPKKDFLEQGTSLLDNVHATGFESIWCWRKVSNISIISFNFYWWLDNSKFTIPSYASRSFTQEGNAKYTCACMWGMCVGSPQNSWRILITET